MSFSGPDGALPDGGVTIYHGTNIFSTTGEGGAVNGGVLYQFILDSAGTNGTFSNLWNFGIDSTNAALPTNGAAPSCAPITADGVLFYGSTGYTTIGGGGVDGNGTYYCISNGGGTNVRMIWSTVLQQTNGEYPYGGLTWGRDGYMYGATAYGGDYNAGTIGRLSTNGELTVLYTFTNGYDGYAPASPLTLGPDGRLYGMTIGFDSVVDYIVYRFDPATGEFDPLADIQYEYALQGTAHPLAVGPDGALYGDDATGGDSYGGELFRIDTNGNFTSLISFSPEYFFGYDLRYVSSPASEQTIASTTSTWMLPAARPLL